MLAMVGAHGFALAANRASDGVYCGADGVFIGPVPLLKRVGAVGAWSVRPRAELNEELSAQYRLLIDIAAKANALALIAHALNRSDLAMAAIAAVQMQLPDPPPAMAAEAQDQLVKRAGELRRIGLLKFWDPLQHPRAGIPPNPGRFAPVSGEQIGGDFGFVEHMHIDGSLPYLAAVSSDPPVDACHVEFLTANTPTAIPARFILSFDELKKIALHFLETGERSEAVAWESI